MFLTLDRLHKRPLQCESLGDAVTFIGVATSASLHALSYVRDVVDVGQVKIVDSNAEQVSKFNNAIQSIGPGELQRKKHFDAVMHPKRLVWNGNAPHFDHSGEGVDKGGQLFRNSKGWKFVIASGTGVNDRKGYWNHGYLHPDAWDRDAGTVRELLGQAKFQHLSDAITETPGPVIAYVSDAIIKDWRHRDPALLPLLNERVDCIPYTNSNVVCELRRKLSYPEDPHHGLQPYLKRARYTKQVKPSDIERYLRRPVDTETLFAYYPSWTAKTFEKSYTIMSRLFEVARDHCSTLVILEHNRYCKCTKPMHNNGSSLRMLEHVADTKSHSLQFFRGFGDLRRNYIATFKFEN
jgi:hypothetical protein